MGSSSASCVVGEITCHLAQPTSLGKKGHFSGGPIVKHPNYALIWRESLVAGLASCARDPSSLRGPPHGEGPHTWVNVLLSLL